ncbi:recombination regulator RecX [Herbaspirillum sp. alder98]|uniref:recombination regulator RecX n=1 Tax=Herbaspirillum sp. alder98 TaxID=2913096 RepID=UPI001CD847B0|nr:recombination regulator RecX [Herbaspirillum sp. alder98]MCA1325272.1 recombination regulator RecX [Herbaspirillum sp. alder98]
MPRPPISLKARALKYLSSREHSRLELARKLAPYAQEGDDIEALLDWLEQSRFLSQERFSESLVHRRAARYGNNRILSELHSHGIEGDALSELRQDLKLGEAARAAEVLRRKYAAPAPDAESRAKQQRFLMQRGFSHDSIRAALKLAWLAGDDQ